MNNFNKQPLPSSKGKSQNWSFIEAAGTAKKQKKGGPFLSKERNEKPPKVKSKQIEKVRQEIQRAKEIRKQRMKRGPEFKIKKDSNGNYYFQPRVNGRFGPRKQISESLAIKLLDK